ncbi:hypothetical protein ACFQX7_06840 [Luedemannella flava]
MDGGSLAAARDRVRRHEDALRRRAAIERRLAEVSRELPPLADAAAARRRDVDRLDGAGVAALLARLAGGYLARRTRAVAAAEAAERLLAERRARRRELIAERATVDRELAGLRDVFVEYERAVADAERDLAGDPRGAELVALNDQVADLRAVLHRYDRALRAGHGALTALDAVLLPLGRAELLSKVDLFVGGIIDIWEHEQLAVAKAAAWAAQRSLDHFASELADLGRPADPPPMGTISARWFVDMFLDGIVVDLVKHARIERAQDRVGAARRWVLVGTTRLEIDRKAAARDLARLTADRDRLLAA